MTPVPPDYVGLLDTLVAELRASLAVTVEHAVLEPPRDDVPKALTAYPELESFYHQIDSFALSWRITEQRDPDFGGAAEIISSRYFDDDQTPIPLDPGEYWKVNDEQREVSGKFMPIDIIEDNACVGVFDDKEIDGSEIYFHDFGIHFYNLRIDWPDYVRLLQRSRAVRYWQKAILEWEYSAASTDADRFGEIMSSTPGFPSESDFKASYYSLRRQSSTD